MKTLQKILMPIDFSSVAQNAVQHANSIAEQQLAEVMLVYISKSGSLQEEQAIQENFRKFEAATLKNAPFLYKFEVLRGDLLKQLAKASVYYKAAMVIMGLRERVSDFSLAAELMRQKALVL